MGVGMAQLQTLEKHTGGWFWRKRSSGGRTEAEPQGYRRRLLGDSEASWLRRPGGRRGRRDLKTATEAAEGGQEGWERDQCSGRPTRSSGKYWVTVKQALLHVVYKNRYDPWGHETCCCSSWGYVITVADVDHLPWIPMAKRYHRIEQTVSRLTTFLRPLGE
jgi:hypothetical protein